MSAKVGRIKTGRRRIGDDYIVAEYGFDSLNGPGRESFGVTASLRNVRDTRSEGHSFGCLHDHVAKAYPELKPLLPWHGMMADGPMHYDANAAYHYELMLGIGEYQKPEDDPAKCLRHLKSTVVFGALPDDEETLAHAMAEPVDLTTANMVLENRRHDLTQAQGRLGDAEAALKRLREEVYQCERAVGTVMKEIRAKRTAPIRAWCERRKPALMSEFIKTMRAFGLWEE